MTSSFQGMAEKIDANPSVGEANIVAVVRIYNRRCLQTDIVWGDYTSKKQGSPWVKKSPPLGKSPLP